MIGGWVLTHFLTYICIHTCHNYHYLFPIIIMCHTCHVGWSSGQAWWPVGVACRDTCPVLVGPVDRHDDQLVWHVVIHVLCWLVQWTGMMTSWCGMSWYMSCVDWSSGQSWWPVGVTCGDTCPVLVGPVDRHDDQLVWHVVIHVLCWLVQWTGMMTSWCDM